MHASKHNLKLVREGGTTTIDAFLMALARSYHQWGEAVDTRYATRDITVATLELTTFSYAPLLCALTLGAIRWKLWWRDLAQIVLCVSWIYGSVIMIASAAGDEKESIFSLKFPKIKNLVAFISLNSVWITIPYLMICDSIERLADAITAKQVLDDQQEAAAVEKNKQKEKEQKREKEEENKKKK